MGGAVSTGIDNDHLTDNLIDAKFIKTPLIEKVFRTVDRSFYFLPEFRKAAYKDLAWKHGNLHLSAPCIYSTVLEELSLKPGQSFLNIGSGTGYLSTMVGMILGPYGVNHGIEIHQDVVEYAYKKLELFKSQCSAVDVFEFCEPYFIVGNGFHLQSDRKYDRIYCGAACPAAFHDNIKEYLKIGGILIVPCEDDLLKFVRKSQNTWEVHPVLQVSFSTLHLPDRKLSPKSVEFEEIYPPGLQSLCRTSIRTTIRDACEKEDPSLTRPCERLPKETQRRRHPAERELVIPIFENLSNVTSGAISHTETSNRGNGRLNFGRRIFYTYSNGGFETLIRSLTRDDDHDQEHSSNENELGQENSGDDQTAASNEPDEAASTAAAIPVGTRPDATLVGSSVANDVEDSTENKDDDVDEVVKEESEERLKDSVSRSSNRSSKKHLSLPEGNRENVTQKCRNSDTANINKSRRVIDNSSCARTPWKLPSDVDEYTLTLGGSTTAVTASTSLSVGPSLSQKLGDPTTACELRRDHPKSSSIRIEDDDEDEEEDEDDDFCGSLPKKMAKREKLDSGISEESDDGKVSASNASSYSESTFSEAMDVESDDSDFSDYSSNDARCFSSSEMESSDAKFETDESKMSVKYRMALEKRIQVLPLPNPIKIYLNYGREFKFSR